MCYCLRKLCRKTVLSQLFVCCSHYLLNASHRLSVVQCFASVCRLQVGIQLLESEETGRRYRRLSSGDCCGFVVASNNLSELLCYVALMADSQPTRNTAREKRLISKNILYTVGFGFCEFFASVL